MEEESRFQLEDYIEIILYRKWLLILPVVILVVLTAVGSKFLPDIYRSETVILVEPQQIPEEYVRSTVTLDLEQRIANIRLQILSRTRLEEIISHPGINLYPDLVAAWPMEAVVRVMQRNIEIQVQGRDSFRIAFMGGDRYTVQKVTNRLASTFINENLRDREAQAVSTLAFIDSELERVRALLEEQERGVQEFKTEHLGELPEQQEANQRRLDRLQDQVQTISAELAEAEGRKVLLQSARAEIVSSTIVEGDTGDLVSIDRQLETLRARLASLLRDYTENHPDVRRVRSEIAALERTREEAARQGDVRSPRSNARTRELDAELERVNIEIHNLRAERNRTRLEIATYQRRVEAAPRVQAALQRLTRRYDKTKEDHDNLLTNRQDAHRSANLEIEQRGQQFKILDRAQLPQNPYKPKRMRIVLFGFLLGIGIGLGAIFLAEHFDHSFRDAEDLENECGMAVLATVPTFALKARGQTRRVLKILALVIGAILVFLLVGMAVVVFGFGLNLMEFLRG